MPFSPRSSCWSRRAGSARPARTWRRSDRCRPAGGARRRDGGGCGEQWDRRVGGVLGVRGGGRGGGGGHGHGRAPGAVQAARSAGSTGGGACRRAGGGRSVRTPISYFLLLSGVLFTIGTVGVLVRRNALVIFMSIELQLNAVNLALVAFSRLHRALDGQVLAFFSMVVAAAEVVVGLAIIVAMFNRRRSANVDDASLLKW